MAMASPRAARPPPIFAIHNAPMDDTVAAAKRLITKWDSLPKTSSIFHQDPDEARQYLVAVYDLQRAMRFLTITSSKSLVLAQKLMQSAMKRLQAEFLQVLSSNRHRLDSGALSSAKKSLSRAASAPDLHHDKRSIARAASTPDLHHWDLPPPPPVDRSNTNSSEDEADRSGVGSGSGAESPEYGQGHLRLPIDAVFFLRSIAECMVSSGYAAECAHMYQTCRRVVVDEGLRRLGFDRKRPSQVHKLDWESLEKHIRVWHDAAPAVVRSLFTGERVLCDFVFGTPNSIGESCFAEVTKVAAVQFLGFPDLATEKTKRTVDKMFLFLDMYKSVSALMPEIESVFAYESTSVVVIQARCSLMKLGETVRSMLTDFEAAIEKYTSKSVDPVTRKKTSRYIAPGGGLHPLTHYVMNRMAILGNYGGPLADILADHPLPSHSPRSQLPSHGSTKKEEEELATPVPAAVGSGEPSSVSAWLAWLMMVLLCKLDVKAEFYNDATLSYLFLANNLQYVVTKVRESNLAALLGHGWADTHEQKAMSFAKSCERLAWSKVLEAIPFDPSLVIATEGVAALKCRMKQFNRAFEEACKRQSGWVVLDGRTREELKTSIAKKVVGQYRPFYEQCKAAVKAESGDSPVAVPAVVRFAPEDVEKCMSALYSGSSGGGSTGGGSSFSIGLSTGAAPEESGGSSSSKGGSRWRLAKALVHSN